MTGRRRGAIAWVGALSALVASVAALAALGAFREAEPIAALRVEPGDVVSLTRWDLTVESCEYSPPEPGHATEFGEVVVRGTATNTSDASLPMVNQRTYMLHLPNGEVFGGWEGQYYAFVDPVAHGPFDPLIPAEYEIIASLETDGWPESGAEIKVRLADEFQRDGFLVGGSWEPDFERAHLWLPCPTSGGL